MNKTFWDTGAYEPDTFDLNGCPNLTKLDVLLV